MSGCWSTNETKENNTAHTHKHGSQNKNSNRPVWVVVGDWVHLVLGPRGRWSLKAEARGRRTKRSEQLKKTSPNTLAVGWNEIESYVACIGNRAHIHTNKTTGFSWSNRRSRRKWTLLFSHHLVVSTYLPFLTKRDPAGVKRERA